MRQMENHMPPYKTQETPSWRAVSSDIFYVISLTRAFQASFMKTCDKKFIRNSTLTKQLKMSDDQHVQYCKSDYDHYLFNQVQIYHNYSIILRQDCSIPVDSINYYCGNRYNVDCNIVVGNKLTYYNHHHDKDTLIYPKGHEWDHVRQETGTGEYNTLKVFTIENDEHETMNRPIPAPVICWHNSIVHTDTITSLAAARLSKMFIINESKLKQGSFK